MSLVRLQVMGVRILRDERLEPVAGLNVITGANGAGKTSLLEAIHLLGTGHSFRSRQLGPVLGAGAEAVQVTASIRDPGEAAPYPVGIRKSATATEVRIRGQRARGLAELARQLPVQAIHPESHVLVAGPPGHRRAFLDWGAFYREQDFHRVWQRYRRLLQQRNAVLRSGGDPRQLGAWEAPLAAAGEDLDEYRLGYHRMLKEAVRELARAWPEAGDLGSEYRRGWPRDQSLAEALERNRKRDRAAGFTHVGPHRCDVVWRVQERPAAEVVSRGQQKTLVMILKLAQARLLRADTGLAPVMLVDDLPSELDPAHRSRVMDLLGELGSQAFVTAIESSSLDTGGWPESKMFHVEQGRIRVVA
jgi:DNA replication and repair protein RecF